MSLKIVVFLLGMSALAGVALGYFLRWALTFGKKGSIELKIQQMTLNAQEKYKEIINKAEKKAEKVLGESDRERKEKQQELKKTEDRLIKKEDFLDKRQLEISTETKKIEEKIEKIKKIKENIDKIKEEETKELQKIAQLSKEEAQEKLLKTIENNYEEDLTARLQKLEQNGEEKLERKAQDILITAIHRMGNSVASDVLSTTVNIPSDDIKGKIIGKEGKNILKDFKMRLSKIKKNVVLVEKLAKKEPFNIKERLDKRLKKIGQKIEVSSEKLAQEVVFLVDKADVTEEVVRLKSHCDLFDDILREGGEVGKRLEFLIQEMNREANTIASKSQNVLITKLAVDIKRENEKIREQVQNRK